MGDTWGCNWPSYRLNANRQGIVDPDVEDDKEGGERGDENKGKLLPDSHLHCVVRLLHFTDKLLCDGAT